ncbi:MAG: hypothetical protein ACSHW7_14085 [Patiriisocius sp.]|uniref:hypothetical protein n=1 Tax=Patiriisocius sp. TaxID=2822396 RepID=UPI003EF83497
MGINSKPPFSFWIIAISAVLWNIVEIYFSSVELDFLQENSTVEEFKNFQALPFWYIIVFIIAIISEMLGSFMLIIRQKIATLFFMIALVTLIFIEGYWLFVVDIQKTSLIFSVIIPVVVIAIASFLYFYSKRASKKGWLS